MDFQALAENIPTLCWIANPDGFIVWYNRRWYEYTGSTPAAMEGWGWQSVHDPAELPKVLERWRVSIATGVPFEMTFPLRAADGRFRPFLTRVVPSFDAGGAITAWYGVNTDISQQRESDEARFKAEAANRAKSEFLASMSHEIRTPLHGVLSYADLLRHTNDLTAEQMQHLDRLQAAGAALLTVVNDVLDFSRIEAGRIELEHQRFSPSALIDNATSIVRSSAERKKLDLSVSIAPELPHHLVGDEDRLRQVLLNLLNNAIKFTSVGTVTLRVTAEIDALDVCSLRFSIEDTGIGIPSFKVHRLFERFSQIDSSIRRDFGGTGLGLAISKRLVELMGGTIGLESKEGRGSMFFFTVALPIAETLAPTLPTAIRVGVETSVRLRILVAEDVVINQDIIRVLLEHANHVVEVVSDGADAITAVQSKIYDLVLMDIQMPGMDGITATQHIRGLVHPASKIPIIAMTANVLPQQIAAFHAAGMDDHIGKPFKRDQLYSVISRWGDR